MILAKNEMPYSHNYYMCNCDLYSIIFISQVLHQLFVAKTVSAYAGIIFNPLQEICAKFGAIESDVGQ
jgi:hypothetical protein